MDDFAFFERRDHACIDVQRHAVLFAQMPQDGKIVGRCWILAQRPNAAERISADVIAGFELHDARRNHVEEGFQRFCFRVGLLFSSENTHPYVVIDNAPTFNTITLNTLFASDELIIPLKIGRFEVAGFIQTINELENLMIDFECQYKINILFNMIPRGRRASYHAFMNKFKEVFDNFDGFYQIQVLNSTVGYQEAVAAKSSLSSKMIIDSKSKIAEDYRNLVKEVLEEEAGD